MKKAQLSVFMILGIFILLIVAVAIYVLGTETRAPRYRIDSLQSLENAYQDCARTAFDTTVKTIGFNGGYAQVPQDLKAEDTGLAFWYKGETVAPSLSRVQEELQTSFVKQFAQDCGSIHVPLKSQGIAVTILEQPQASVSINDNDVTAHLRYPYRATHGDRTQEGQSFVMTKNLPLGHVLRYAHELTKAYSTEGELLASLGCREGIVNFYDYKSAILINLTIHAEQTPFHFFFALENN